MKPTPAFPAQRLLVGETRRGHHCAAIPGATRYSLLFLVIPYCSAVAAAVAARSQLLSAGLQFSGTSGVRHAASRAPSHSRRRRSRRRRRRGRRRRSRRRRRRRSRRRRRRSRRRRSRRRRSRRRRGRRHRGVISSYRAGPEVILTPRTATFLVPPRASRHVTPLLFNSWGRPLQVRAGRPLQGIARNTKEYQGMARNSKG